MSKHHCMYCFEVLESHLNGASIPIWTHEQDRYAVFVSWKMPNGMLRGCLGTLTPCMIGDALAEYAIASASRDHRFNPIRKDELPHLHVAVSLLSHFEAVDHHLDWTLGVHGIIIELEDSGTETENRFRNRKKIYRATFLPEVAIEHGWNQEETLKSLLIKSGYRNHVVQDVLPLLKVTKFRSTKTSLSYSEYLTLRLN